MERRHQVFVSSTFNDLKGERSEIIQALLELDCFPAGMELFPATNGAAWDLIKGVIDDSDYYCLIIGGRYGSVDVDGLGYTEKEYDYAAALGKPIIVFLHKSPGSIPTDRSEATDVGRARLDAFRAKVEAVHHCKYWTSAEELGGQVSRSLVVLRKTHPAEGWVPGRYAADESVLVDNATFRARVSQLEAELVVARTKAVSAPAVDLEKGRDRYTPQIAFMLEGDTDYRTENVDVTWDHILAYLGPTLIGECTEEQFLAKLRLCFFHAIGDEAKWATVVHEKVIIPIVIRDEILIQLRALGHVAAGQKRRPVADQKVYWKLTEQGESHLIQVQARKRRSTEQPKEPEQPRTLKVPDSGAAPTRGTARAAKKA